MSLSVRPFFFSQVLIFTSASLRSNFIFIFQFNFIFKPNRFCHTRKRSRKHTDNNSCTLMIPCVSDSLNRKIRNLIGKFNFDIKLINCGSKKLKDCFL